MTDVCAQMPTTTEYTSSLTQNEQTCVNKSDWFGTVERTAAERHKNALFLHFDCGLLHFPKKCSTLLTFFSPTAHVLPVGLEK